MMLLELEVIAIAVIYSAFAILTQRKLANVDRLYEVRAKMNHHTKKVMEMSKAGQNSPELAAAQKELMELSTQSMKMQFKPMLVVFPVFLALYYILLPGTLSALGTVSIASVSVSARWFFILITFIVGLLLSVGFSMYDRKRLAHKYNFGLMQPTFKEPGPETQTNQV